MLIGWWSDIFQTALLTFLRHMPELACAPLGCSPQHYRSLSITQPPFSSNDTKNPPMVHSWTKPWKKTLENMYSAGRYHWEAYHFEVCSMMTLARFHIFHAGHGAFLRCCHTLQVSLQRVIIATLVTNRSSLLHSFRLHVMVLLRIQYSIYVSPHQWMHWSTRLDVQEFGDWDCRWICKPSL